ncbi:hypothetical protein WQQ_15370 [Hydrocarboniphaga effusa AP103]|uniref:Uncharacterized protein n=1 Tax=Hydrocarboniphaga effusa AP103 TaxID=1172194 RepID=I8TBX1_9GAMM|nr:hypothetical protein WQQ_15370 [Hydrocarboniphaga effusa AP103]
MKPQITGLGNGLRASRIAASKELRHEAADHQNELSTVDTTSSGFKGAAA